MATNGQDKSGELRERGAVFRRAMVEGSILIRLSYVGSNKKCIHSKELRQQRTHLLSVLLNLRQSRGTLNGCRRISPVKQFWANVRFSLYSIYRTLFAALINACILATLCDPPSSTPLLTSTPMI